MSKTERYLPDTTLGGRIRKMRQKSRLSQVALYDLAFPYGEAKSDENKARVIRDWEIAGKSLDDQKLIGICKALNCSADYLLGLDECTNKANQFIHDQTGLSEEAINILRFFEGKDEFLLPMDFLLRNERFVLTLPCFYGAAFSRFLAEYASLKFCKEGSELYIDISDEYSHAEEVEELNIQKALFEIIENLSNEAKKKAEHDVNSPTGCKTFENIVEDFKRKFSRTHLDDDV